MLVSISYSPSPHINLENTGISYCDRILFKHKGGLFYMSTGQNSSLYGFVFPFKGVDKEGWIIKPKGESLFLRNVGKLKKELGFEYDLNFLARFTNYQQIYISYQFGNNFWLTEKGKKLAEYLDFDEKKYRIYKTPTKFLDFGCDLSSINKINKILRANVNYR